VGLTTTQITTQKKTTEKWNDGCQRRRRKTKPTNSLSSLALLAEQVLKVVLSRLAVLARGSVRGRQFTHVAVQAPFRAGLDVVLAGGAEGAVLDLGLFDFAVALLKRERKFS
jgi:hypothetical protein